MSALADVLGVKLPIIQAPMAGSSGVALAVAAAVAGALGSLPCAMRSREQIRADVAAFRAQSSSPVHLNFFAHATPVVDAECDAAWRKTLSPYYAELRVTESGAAAPARPSFDDALCALVEELRPQIVSFHFGLPAAELLARVRATGAKVLCSATTLGEALALEAQGCDAIIAQGAEAGGHRGMFLSADISRQVGAMALTRLIAAHVRTPVIAAGAIADGASVAAAMKLGASGVQAGTAYLRTPECETAPLHRAALAREGETALTNIFTGRPARGIVNRAMRELGPMRADAPAFPRAGAAMAPLRAAAEARGLDDFSPLWAGQAFALAREISARAVTAALASGLA